jgi:hypothetical protein
MSTVVELRAMSAGSESTGLILVEAAKNTKKRDFQNK